MTKRRIWTAALLILLIPAAVVCGYAAYVFSAYYRVEDNLNLQISRGQGEEKPVKEEEMLRITTCNLGFGAYSADYTFFMDGGKESRARSREAVYENIGGAVNTVRKEQPDFLLFQETDEDGDRSYHVNERKLVTDEFPSYDSVFAQNYDSPYLFWPLTEPHGKNRSGILTLSAFPVRSSLRRSLPVEDHFMKIVDLDRCYSVSRIPTEGGKELVLYNVHLSAYTTDGTIAEEQLRVLFSDMLEERKKGNYALAGGDFNKDLPGNSNEIFDNHGAMLNWAQAIPPELIPEGLSLVVPFQEENPIPTCRNVDRPYGPDCERLIVDGFVLSDNMEADECRAIDTGFRYSDHNPVCLDFRLKAEN